MIQSPFMITYDSLLKDPRVEAAIGDEKPVVVRTVLLDLLSTYRTVEIDLSSARTLTPSFAYIAFGHLYDVHRESLLERLHFVNDAKTLASRILAAISRRRDVVLAQ